MKKILLLVSIVAMLSLGVGVAQAVSTLTASETAANVAATTNSTNAAISTTTANAVEVKATTTLTVVTIPAAGTTLRIGECVITFQATASSTAGVKCTGNTMILDVGDVPAHATTTTGLANTLKTLNHVTATTSSATTTSLDFSAGSTTSAVAIQTSASTTEIGGKITITDGTSGAIIVSNSRAGVAPVRQIDQITLLGTPHTGDTYTIATTTGSYATTTEATDTTLRLITDRLWLMITGEPGYANLTFTVSTTTGDKVVLTAKTMGTAFSAAASTDAGRMQQVTFTVAGTKQGDVFKVGINNKSYSFKATDALDATTATGLAAEVDTDDVVACTASAAVVTCVASTIGTPFSYGAEVDHVSTGGGGSSSGGSSSSGGGSSSSHSATPATPAIPANPGVNSATPAIPASPALFNRLLKLGVSGDDVTALQERLTSEGVYSGPITGYFGNLTMAGLKAYQKANGLSAVGQVGPATRALLNGSNAGGANMTAETRTAAIQSITAQIQNLLKLIAEMQAAGAE